MAEFFLELFSEEIPSGLQKNLREKLLEEFKKFFLEKSIKSKKSFSLSTPNRLIVVFEGLDKQIKVSSEEIKGPRINAPEQAIEGFIKSNKIEKKLSLPGYDQCLKASHVFNILDARGAISVAQRAEYISRIRDITKSVASIWIDTQS